MGQSCLGQSPLLDNLASPPPAPHSPAPQPSHPFPIARGTEGDRGARSLTPGPPIRISPAPPCLCPSLPLPLPASASASARTPSTRTRHPQQSLRSSRGASPAMPVGLLPLAPLTAGTRTHHALPPPQLMAGTHFRAYTHTSPCHAPLSRPAATTTEVAARPGPRWASTGPGPGSLAPAGPARGRWRRCPATKASRGRPGCRGYGRAADPGRGPWRGTRPHRVWPPPVLEAPTAYVTRPSGPRGRTCATLRQAAA